MNKHTFRIWLHIEEIDEHGYPEETEPTLPAQYGEFDTLPAAQEAVELIMSGHDYRPRPSAPDKNGAHTPGPWSFTRRNTGCNRYANVLSQDGRRIAFVYSEGSKYSIENAEANARLIAAAPALLNMLQRMLDETAGGGRPCLCTLEHARNALAKAKGE
jgi:hypothetical protein